MIVQRLLILVRLFGRLPDAIDRSFAKVLNAATRPFDVINYYGSCLATRVYNRERMARKLPRPALRSPSPTADLDETLLTL